MKLSETTFSRLLIRGSLVRAQEEEQIKTHFFGGFFCWNNVGEKLILSERRVERVFYLAQLRLSQVARVKINYLLAMVFITGL